MTLKKRKNVVTNCLQNMDMHVYLRFITLFPTVIHTMADFIKQDFSAQCRCCRDITILHPQWQCLK